MWRIHFTREDLARTFIAPGPDYLWELTLSLHMLTGVDSRKGARIFGLWRRQVAQAIRDSDLTSLVRNFLYVLAPSSTYFPDFLTPSTSVLGLEEGLDTIAGTRRIRLKEELALMDFGRSTPGWTFALADGEREMREALLSTLRTYFKVALEPYWSQISDQIHADRAVRTADLRCHGVEGVLSNLGPSVQWKSSVLTYYAAGDYDVHLDGRGLLLQPSFFCWGLPTRIADPELPPVLIYPIAHQPIVPTGAPPLRLERPEIPSRLTGLIGSTRAGILGSIADGRTTSELAQLLDIGASSVSQHTGMLRDAALITSYRQGNQVVHSLTALGSALLTGRIHECKACR